MEAAPIASVSFKQFLNCLTLSIEDHSSNLAHGQYYNCNSSRSTISKVHRPITLSFSLTSLPPDFRHANELVCQAAVESIVRERFGSKCFRVFRLLLMKKMMEQKQVADLAMIPGKEAKEMLYTLLAENFITLQVSLTVIIVTLPCRIFHCHTYIVCG